MHIATIQNNLDEFCILVFKKFNKKKHKKSKWMTYGILNSINKKDRLYKLFLKTDVNSEKYAALKATFKQYRETLRSSIKEAKRLYYHRTFLLYQKM